MESNSIAVSCCRVRRPRYPYPRQWHINENSGLEGRKRCKMRNGSVNQRPHVCVRQESRSCRHLHSYSHVKFAGGFLVYTVTNGVQYCARRHNTCECSPNCIGCRACNVSRFHNLSKKTLPLSARQQTSRRCRAPPDVQKGFRPSDTLYSFISEPRHSRRTKSLLLIRCSLRLREPKKNNNTGKKIRFFLRRFGFFWCSWRGCERPAYKIFMRLKYLDIATEGKGCPGTISGLSRAESFRDFGRRAAADGLHSVTQPKHSLDKTIHIISRDKSGGVTEASDELLPRAWFRSNEVEEGEILKRESASSCWQP